jgi:hypothetical protein
LNSKFHFILSENSPQEFNRAINASDARAPKKIARYHFKDGTFRDEATIDQTAVHYSIEGYDIFSWLCWYFCCEFL